MKEITYKSGIGFLGALGIAFIVLKLCHVIEWSWWWVLAPLWGPIALAIVLCAIIFLIALIKGIIDTIKTRKSEE